MALRAVGVVPGTAAQVQFENRLLHSNEPYSTFALANSLAGFLVGPLVVMLAVRLGQPDPPRGQGVAARRGPAGAAAARWRCSSA